MAGVAVGSDETVEVNSVLETIDVRKSGLPRMERVVRNAIRVADPQKHWQRQMELFGKKSLRQVWRTLNDAEGSIKIAKVTNQDKAHFIA